NGVIEFLGRVDFQVKIRGFRIELGEIETCLAQHPSIRECVVLVQQLSHDDKRLVAYMVAGSTPAPTASELRQILGEHMPAYMVPSSFVYIDAFPLTPNGKLDRAALPLLEAHSANVEENYIAPQTE